MSASDEIWKMTRFRSNIAYYILYAAFIIHHFSKQIKKTIKGIEKYNAKHSHFILNIHFARNLLEIFSAQKVESSELQYQTRGNNYCKRNL